MELEISLEPEEETPGERDTIRRLFLAWYAAGEENRLNSSGYGELVELEGLCFRLDPGRIDVLTAIHDLHARLQGHGASIFIRFLYRQG